MCLCKMAVVLVILKSTTNVSILGAVFIKKVYSKLHVVFPKLEYRDQREERKGRENSLQRVQMLSPPYQFSLNAIIIKIDPLDIKCMIFLHVVRVSSITVA